MQNAMRDNAIRSDDAVLDEELVDTLIAISVVSKRLAMNLIHACGGKSNEQNE